MSEKPTPEENWIHLQSDEYKMPKTELTAAEKFLVGQDEFNDKVIGEYLVRFSELDKREVRNAPSSHTESIEKFESKKRALGEKIIIEGMKSVDVMDMGWVRDHLKTTMRRINNSDNKSDELSNKLSNYIDGIEDIRVEKVKENQP